MMFFFVLFFFAVNTTVIFVTEVIFLGIYCTFLSWGTLRNQHLSMRFLKKKEEEEKRWIIVVSAWKTISHDATFQI